MIKLSYFCSAGNPLGPVVANSAGSLNVGESCAHYSCRVLLAAMAVAVVLMMAKGRKM